MMNFNDMQECNQITTFARGPIYPFVRGWTIWDQVKLIILLVFFFIVTTYVIAPLYDVSVKRKECDALNKQIVSSQLVWDPSENICRFEELTEVKK